MTNPIFSNLPAGVVRDDDRGQPHFYFTPTTPTPPEGSDWYEMFEFVPHDEIGWVVLGWTKDDPDGEDNTCTEAYEFGADVRAALNKLAELVAVRS